jgi:hypothetical protein
MAFPVGWQRVCPLVIQQSLVNAGRLKNFPVLITAACLPAEMVTTGDPNAAQSDGGDIRFSADSAGLTQLACEVVLWSQNAVPANAKAELWVQVPAIGGVYNTTIYVWYKAGGGLTQPAANATFGSQAVWAGYAAVYHLADGSTLSLADSTANGIAGTNHGATAASGQIDGAAAFNGSSQYVALGTPAALRPAGPMTVQAWIKAAASQVSFPQVVSSGDSTGITGCALYLLNSGSPACQPTFIVKEGATSWGGTIASGSVPMNDNAWHSLVGIYEGIGIRIYVDGAVAGFGSGVNQAITYGTSPAAAIGAHMTLSANAYFNGVIDEVRIRPGALSGGWIATEYNNQSDPAAFVVAGPPYAPGAYTPAGGFYRP